MSDTILGGDWTVYYLAENRQKRLEYTGSGTTYTVNSVYSALQDLMDELNQMDDGTVMSAQTPTEYTIGIIDSGDSDPWFIDRTSAEYLYQGALKTASWTRSVGSNTGIVRVQYTYTSTNFQTSDIGKTITTDTDSDSGTILDFQSDGSIGYLWIRPDSSAAANSFDASPTTWDSFSVTGGTGVDALQAAPSQTGESLWSNIYTIGTIQTNTHIYVDQDNTLLTSYKAATDWWDDGHIDILVNVKEVDQLTDEGYIVVFARRYTAAYDYFEVDLSAGGRNPIPLATSADLDNTTGYRQQVLTTASDNFDVGEIIEDDTDDTIQGVITSSSGTAPNITIQYYLIGDPLNDFYNGSGGFTGQTSGETATAVDPTDVGPAALAGLSITHTSRESGDDIDEDGTDELYSIAIDCSDEDLTDVWEWIKYETRRGESTTTNTDGQEAQFYIGNDYRVEYTGITGSISEGDVVTQVTTGATGTVVAHHTTNDILMLRSSRGTFNDVNNIEVDGSNYVTGPTCTVITPTRQSPFGTFAGGTFFGATGVVLLNYKAADANSFQLTDDEGNVVTVPVKVSVEVTNTRVDDRIAVFRLTGSGGDIDKTEYSTAAGGAIGNTTIVVGSAINITVPGKSQGGVIRMVDVDNELEYRLRYASWDTSTFTLDYIDGNLAETGTDTDTIVDTGAFTDTLVGDLVINRDRADAVSYVTEVTDANTIQISPAIASQTTGDEYDVNTVPFAYDASDYAYISFIDVHETTGSDGTPGSEETAGGVTYSGGDFPIYVRVRARQAGDIIPFETDSQITTAGMSVAVIRTPDTIYA